MGVKLEPEVYANDCYRLQLYIRSSCDGNPDARDVNTLPLLGPDPMNLELAQKAWNVLKKGRTTVHLSFVAAGRGTRV